ncbi:hypothetical protein D3C73_1021330 [compost metagenome]
MGGQHGRDQGLAQQGAHRVRADAAVSQPFQRALGSVGALARLGLGLGAALARAVLGDVGQQGKGGEAVHQADGLIQRQLAQQPLQLGRAVRGRVAVIGHRGAAHRLDAVVEGLSALVADHLAEQGAQQPDLLAQLVVGELRGLGHAKRLSAGRPERNRISGIRTGQSISQRRNALCGRRRPVLSRHPRACPGDPDTQAFVGFPPSL